MRSFLMAVLLLLYCAVPSWAQAEGLEALLAKNQAAIAKPSRATAETVIKDLLASGAEGVQPFLEKWGKREVWVRKADGAFFTVEKDGENFKLIDIATGKEAGTAQKGEIDQVKPNAGVQALVTGALVQFQLSDADPARRAAALADLERKADAAQLAPLRASIEGETDAVLKQRKERLARLLTIRFGATPDERVAAIKSFEGDIAVDVRSALNPLLATERKAAATVPKDVNIARQLKVGADITTSEAYDLLVSAQLAPPRVLPAERNTALAANMKDGAVGGLRRDQLNTEEARDKAYAALVQQGVVKPSPTTAEQARAVTANAFYEQYAEPSFPVTQAAIATLGSISRSVAVNQVFDLSLDALSLASIYFLAAIGLAITFGVMGVINMAHGEFIMMGAYTGYVVQLWIPDYTVSIIVALPLAFCVTFLAGVAMERLVIRHLMHRPLETLLATFGISIALQQIAKNIFGTQARPLTAPAWLDGSWVVNDIVSISYIRIAIFFLALIFLAVLLLILRHTRLGLEVRAVTQNRRMAASMGINPNRINMLTFGLGSGIAGIAGVAIGLFAQVTSEVGSNYIVQSFMAVVVGGVGNIWGTLAGASLIGILQKIIEWFNPSNTLAAQTYMIIFIIIFIQFRPRGIIALRGRAAGD
ncbi:urea ABC transporter permease subunit UrtB [Aestuariivirga sp.]|uniref:urea ABC transporter permease subunit UrtB n=1 Tax=Aestuariivirga sp. TaxID=2650926 RepID=UPI0039E46FC6